MTTGTRIDEANWLAEQRYLPRFMRDFHTQKDVFKLVWRAVERQKAKGVDTGVGAMTWIGAHVFTIDYFLWFMARHGYTLQKTKRPWPTADWQATLDDMKREEAEAFRKMLGRDASAGDGTG